MPALFMRGVKKPQISADFWTLFRGWKTIPRLIIRLHATFPDKSNQRCRIPDKCLIRNFDCKSLIKCGIFLGDREMLDLIID